MKKLVFLSFFIFTFWQITKAQNPDFPPLGTNFPNPTLDQFVGTWTWSNGTDTLKINLKKVNINLLGYNHDMLLGYHYYKKGNTVIESSFGFLNSSFSQKKHTLLVDNDNGLGENILTGGIKDITKDKDVFIKLTVNIAQKKMTMFIKEYAGVSINNPTPHVYTLPNNITLKKEVIIPDVE